MKEKKRARLEEDASSSSDEETVPKNKITVTERLQSSRSDVSSLIASYAESDEEDTNRGYVKKEDINRKVYEEEEQDEEDIAAMKQRVKKKMRETRAKDIKRQKKKREKRREMKSGNLIVTEQKESVVTVKVDAQKQQATPQEKQQEKQQATPQENQVKVYKTPAYKRKHYTVSIAIPGSILEKSDDALRTRLCGDIARAATLFRVDEVIIYNEAGSNVDMTNFLPNIQHTSSTSLDDTQDDHDGSLYRDRYQQHGSKKLMMDDNVFLANILYFLETPPYLRYKLFPDPLDCLKHAINLPTLSAPHHLMAREFPHRYRDGVVVENNLVFVGHQKLCMIKNVNLPIGIRVTVETFKEEKDLFLGRVVSSTEPKNKEGIYWGYNVRVANSLSHAITECPHKQGYDAIVAIGEGGRSVDDDDYSLPPFQHLLLVFGKDNDDGLSSAMLNDKRFPFGTDVRDVFDQYIDICPHRGSKNLQTQEAVTIALATLRKRLDRNMPPVTATVSKFSTIKLR
jgi:predicted SPOUT superfamily RNA methylase MTH1